MSPEVVWNAEEMYALTPYIKSQSNDIDKMLYTIYIFNILFFLEWAIYSKQYITTGP